MQACCEDQKGVQLDTLASREASRASTLSFMTTSSEAEETIVFSHAAVQTAPLMNDASAQVRFGRAAAHLLLWRGTPASREPRGHATVELTHGTSACYSHRSAYV